jgi:hypothetical protein
MVMRLGIQSEALSSYVPENSVYPSIYSVVHGPSGMEIVVEGSDHRKSYSWRFLLPNPVLLFYATGESA